MLSHDEALQAIKNYDIDSVQAILMTSQEECKDARNALLTEVDTLIAQHEADVDRTLPTLRKKISCSLGALCLAYSAYNKYKVIYPALVSYMKKENPTENGSDNTQEDNNKQKDGTSENNNDTLDGSSHSENKQTTNNNEEDQPKVSEEERNKETPSQKTSVENDSAADNNSAHKTNDTNEESNTNNNDESGYNELPDEDLDEDKNNDKDKICYLTSACKHLNSHLSHAIGSGVAGCSLIAHSLHNNDIKDKIETLKAIKELINECTSDIDEQ
jgi:cobalamin biosynthesis protein CobT